MVTHFPLERLAKALRADGVMCEIRPGAQGRSARNFASVGYYRGCQAIVQHHTGSSGLYPLNDITYIESGKGEGYVIANAYNSLSGVITLIASGPTYTEGRGGPWGIIPQDRANDVAFSLENASRGNEDSVYPKAQQDAAEAFSYHAALIAAEVWEWPDHPFSPHRVFAHHEWTSRKIDPTGISDWSPTGGKWSMDAHRTDLDLRLQEELAMAGMNTPFIRIKGYDDQWLAIPISAETKRRLNPDDEQKVAITLDPNGMTEAELEAKFGYQLTPNPNGY